MSLQCSDMEEADDTNMEEEVLVTLGYSDLSVFWEIEKFFSLPLDVGYKIRSPPFGFYYESFFFELYPNGKTSRNAGFVGLYLINTTSELRNRDIEFKISVWTEHMESIVEKNKTAFKPTKDHWGADRFIERSRLVSQNTESVQEGSLSVCCKFTLQSFEEEKQEEIMARKDVNKLADDFMMMFRSEDLSDFTITVRGREFKCHRVVLAARSPVFAKMIEEDMQQGATEDDWEPEAFQEFLKYMYSGSVDNFSVKNAFDLCRIADKYDTPGVKEKCLDMLTKALSVENFCDIVTLAFKHGVSKVLRKAKTFFAKYNGEILLTASWQNFLKENPNAANEFIKS